MPSDPLPKKEIVRAGIPASPGIAMGPAYIFAREIPRIVERSLADEEIAAEISRLLRAIDKSSKELTKILSFAREKVGDAKARILEAQIMVLEDKVLIDAIQRRIGNEKKNAEYIVHAEIEKYADLMRAAPDEYMHERAQDMEDLKNRIVRNLQEEKLISRLEGSVIVIAHTLTPADTMILSRNHILGYATDLGGVTSHAAVFSRSLKIPAIVGLGDVSRGVQPGDTIVLDGYSGSLIIHPSPERIAEFERMRERMLKFESKLVQLRDLPARTADGHNLELSANIELPEELEYVVGQGSQGVGLFRTESLLVGRDDFPSEEEQFQEYKKIADRLYPHRVIMRTFDIGGDKIASETAEEANPFLGWRGIRISLDRPELFMNQIRAMLRASTRKNLAIMFPMVTTIGEVIRAKEYVRKAKAELRAKKIKFDDKLQLGVMIEVPAAALMAAQIAAEVDFLSIGSNDLTQYLLAVDRGNSLVSSLYQEFEPSVLGMLRQVINAGHRKGVWVGLCGEMAGNPLATPILIGLGVDELSVVPSVLPEIKKIIRALNYHQSRELARNVLELPTGKEVEAYMRTLFRKQFADIPLGHNKM